MAIAGLALAAVLLVRQFRKPQPISEAIMQGLAEAVVDELSAKLGLSGKIVLVHGTGNETDPPAVALLPAQLARAVEKRGLGKIVKTVQIRTVGSDLSDLPKDAPVPVQVQLPYAQVPYDEFSKALSGQEDAVAFISLAGPPRVTAADASRWASATAKIVVVMPVGDPTVVRNALSRGIVALAVVPRQRGLTAGAQAGRGRAWFDSQYQVLTPATVADMN